MLLELGQELQRCKGAYALLSVLVGGVLDNRFTVTLDDTEPFIRDGAFLEISRRKQEPLHIVRRDRVTNKNVNPGENTLMLRVQYDGIGQYSGSGIGYSKYKYLVDSNFNASMPGGLFWNGGSHLVVLGSSLTQLNVAANNDLPQHLFYNGNIDHNVICNSTFISRPPLWDTVRMTPNEGTSQFTVFNDNYVEGDHVEFQFTATGEYLPSKYSEHILYERNISPFIYITDVNRKVVLRDNTITGTARSVDLRRNIRYAGMSESLIGLQGVYIYNNTINNPSGEWWLEVTAGAPAPYVYSNNVNGVLQSGNAG